MNLVGFFFAYFLSPSGFFAAAAVFATSSSFGGGGGGEGSKKEAGRLRVNVPKWTASMIKWQSKMLLSALSCWSVVMQFLIQS